MQLSKWLRANVDVSFQAVFPAVRAVSLLIFIIPQENRKVYYFLRDFIFFTKSCFFQPPTDSPLLQAIWARSGLVREEMRLLIGRREGSSRRATPAAAPPPCRLHFLMFSALHAEKAALLRRKNAFGRTTAFLAPRMPSQNKKAIPYGMTFCFGGDKRDRTADLMTASCYRFVILNVFASNSSVQSTKSVGFCKVLPIASTRFHAHSGHNLGQGK